MAVVGPSASRQIIGCDMTGRAPHCAQSTKCATRSMKPGTNSGHDDGLTSRLQRDRERGVLRRQRP